MNKDKCVQLLESGVEQKRAGNYTKALEYYEMAKSHDPSNRNVYYNPGKLLLGMGKYDEAVNYLLTYSHVMILTNTYRNPMEDMIRQETVSNLRRIDRSITTQFELPPDWLTKIVSDVRFIKPVVDTNCNRYLGICLSAGSRQFNSKNGITEALILDIRNGVLGKGMSGIELTESQECVLAAIGLYFTWKNLDLTVSDLSEVSTMYFQKALLFPLRLED